MFEKLFSLRRSTHVVQAIRFIIVGACNTVIDFSVFIGLMKLNPFFEHYYLTAKACSWVVAVVVSFFANKYWTFQAQGRSAMGKQYSKFFLVSIVALGLSQIILYIFVDHIHLSAIVGNAATIVIVSSWNFFMNKLWTFKSK